MENHANNLSCFIVPFDRYMLVFCFSLFCSAYSVYALPTKQLNNARHAAGRLPDCMCTPRSPPYALARASRSQLEERTPRPYFGMGHTLLFSPLKSKIESRQPWDRVDAHGDPNGRRNSCRTPSPVRPASHSVSVSPVKVRTTVRFHLLHCLCAKLAVVMSHAPCYLSSRALELMPIM